MTKPTKCSKCGNGRFKKAHRDNLLIGSRYWKCKQCGHGVVATAEGYLLDDPTIATPDAYAGLPGVIPGTRAAMEQRLLEGLAGSPTGPSETLNELAKRAVKSQEEFNRRLNSPDRKVREEAEREARKAALDFIMDTSFGGP